jgi:lysine 2,3-aminomutase
MTAAKTETTRARSRGGSKVKTRAPTVRSVSELAATGVIAADRLAELQQVAAHYAVAISPAMLALIDPEDPADPIASQFVPDRAELETAAFERADPIGDDAHSPVEGIVHRYPDRALLKLVHVCPVYCRFCFRREMVGPGGRKALAGAALETAFAYIRAHPEIWEVVLTGGDPLLPSPRRLSSVTRRLTEIAHVKILRLHTRVPAVQPDLVTRELVRAAKCRGKATYVVLHANHPRELTSAALAACARFIDAGIPMLSQTVLLRGVNDSVEVLGELMRRLVEHRIKPYYLHHLDPAPGTSHLRTTVKDGQDVMRALRGRYSGLCQPTYVLDIPGGFGKVPIGPNYLNSSADGCYRIEDPNGSCHEYAVDACLGVER